MQEQTKLEKFLPIGTRVLLKNGKKWSVICIQSWSDTKDMF